MRWVGIDEAGYGPNLGPMVMTAVVAESPGDSATDACMQSSLDFWSDLAETVDRAGGDHDRVWIDDSKAILRGGKGRDRLEIACLAAIHATRHELPGCLRELVELLGAGSLTDVELDRWGEGRTEDRAWPPTAVRDAVLALVDRKPFVSPIATWRIAAVISVVVGPAKFNGGLEVHGSKAAVHFEAFDRLLKQVWDRAADGRTTFVKGDKHGGRHYYLGRFHRPFPRHGSIGATRALTKAATRSATEPKARADPDAPSRSMRRPGRPGIDREQDGSGTLDGRIQRLLARTNSRPPSHGGLPF